MSFRIVAHRGASATHPENTMAAFEAAIEAGADLIGLEVQATGDGELIVLHDFDLGRTIPGDGLIVSREAAFVRELDAGSWFDKQFADQRVPLLADVLDAFGGQAQFQIELRGFNADFVHAVMEMVLNHQLSDDVFITSEQLPLLLIAQDQHPDARVGLFAPTKHDWMSISLWQALTITHVQLLDGESVHAPLQFLDANFVERLHDLEVDVHGTGANTAGLVHKANEIDLDEISTDDPAMAAEVRDAL